MAAVCEDSKTYQGMVQLVIFKLSLKSEPDNNGYVAQLSECYDFKQLKQLLTVAFQKEVAFRVKVLRFEMRKALFVGKQRLATGRDCSTVVYILGKAWSKYGKHMACVRK